jgi:hypothetical protein
MHDVFNGYHNLLNGTLNIVVHEWAHDLNTSFENSSFQIDGTFIMMHYWCLEKSVYVHVIFVIVQHTINQVQRQCFKVITKLNDELEKLFLTHWAVTNALGVVYP